MEFEDILLELGDNGIYQKRLIMFFLLPSAILFPWFGGNTLFMVSIPDHWCNVPEVVASNLTIEQQRRLISPPSDPKCLMYDVNYTDYLDSGTFAVPNNTNTIPCNNGWQFDKTYYDETVATRWNMYCGDDHYKNFVLTVGIVGSIVGTPIYGALSDRIGRKTTFFIVLFFKAVTSLILCFMTNFTAFVIMKGLTGSVLPSLLQLPFIIVLELVAPEMRTHMNGLVNSFWTVGSCMLPLIAYLSRTWINLGLFTSVVTFLFFGYLKFLPESPRWLLSQERYDEALVILKKIGEVNGKPPSDEDQLLEKLKIVGEKIRREKTVDKIKNSPMDILRYPQLRKIFFIITICWMADILAYDGLQLNVYNLAGNEFLNYFLTAVVEIPGYMTIWFLMDRYGRRWSTAGGFLSTGIICMLPIFILDLPYADIIFSMLGKYFCSAAYMATYQQSSELYPTVVRSLGMGMNSTVSKIVFLGLPYLIYLSVYGKAIPFIIIGTVAIIAGISASFLPETLNENLPQSIADAEAFGKDQKFFSWNRRQKSVCRERAASLALQPKSFNDLELELNKEAQAKPNSQMPLNGELTNREVSEDNKSSRL